MTPEEHKNHQNVKVWNAAFTLLFAILLVCAHLSLENAGRVPTEISVFHFIILSLAIFRMIRLVSYDAILKFVRELFMVKTIHENGNISYEEAPRGMKRTITDLLGCPWCTGVWIALLFTYLFFMFPALFIVFLLLAVAGAGSMLQLLANLIGWSAEYKKQTTERL